MQTLFKNLKSIHAKVTMLFRSLISCLCLSSQDAFVELYDRQRDSVFSCSWPSIKTVFGLAALGAASLTIGAYLTQKWTRPLFNQLDFFHLSIFLLFFLVPLLLPPPSLHLFLRCPWPLRDNLQTLLNLFKASPRKNSLFPAFSCQNIHKSKQLKKPEAKPTEQRMHFRWNRTKLTTTAEKRGVHVFAFAFFRFLFARPASLGVIAWTLSVSLDVACVGPRFGGLRGGSGGGRM